MARFATLCSSSKGNSTYIGTAEHGILVDAGSSAKQLDLALQKLKLSHEAVKAIFVTHEHKDHISAIRVFASRYQIPVYASEGTCRAMQNADVFSGQFPAYSMKGNIRIGDMTVSAFRTSHDAAESTGYIIDLGERRVGICTDTGIIMPDMVQRLKECDLVLLESNHDPKMLDCGPYPLPLRLRIKSDYGHLSNGVCAETAAALLNSGRTRHFVLGHLSQENNTPELAFSCTKAAFDAMGAVENKDYLLQVAPVKCCEKYMIF